MNVWPSEVQTRNLIGSQNRKFLLLEDKIQDGLHRGAWGSLLYLGIERRYTANSCVPSRSSESGSASEEFSDTESAVKNEI